MVNVKKSKNLKDVPICIHDDEIFCITTNEAVDEGLPYLTEGFPSCCPSRKHCAPVI